MHGGEGRTKGSVSRLYLDVAFDNWFLELLYPDLSSVGRESFLEALLKNHFYIPRVVGYPELQSLLRRRGRP